MVIANHVRNSANFVDKTSKRKCKKALIPRNFRNREPGFQTLIVTIHIAPTHSTVFSGAHAVGFSMVFNKC